MDEEKFLAEMLGHWLEDRDDPCAELIRIQEQLRSIDVPSGIVEMSM